MLKKHLLLIGMTTSLLLLIIAAFYYPGGSQNDLNSIGYSWENNYLSNLFAPKAVNGMDNLARPWAVAGMLALAISFAIFFSAFSKKIEHKGAARVIQFCGVSAMGFAFLTVTPLHDQMVKIASTLSLVALFYITVFVLKSKLLLFKILSIVILLLLYTSLFLYYSRTYLEFLPIMQKAAFGMTMGWALGLQYFSEAGDFQFGKKTGDGSGE